MNKLKPIIIRSNVFLLFCLTFCLALPQKLSTIFVVILFITSIFNFQSRKLEKAFIPLIVLYFVYIFFEVIYTPIDFSIFEKRAALLALPIVFIFNNYNKETIQKAIIYYVYGVILACLICYINAMISSISFIDGFSFNSRLVSSKSNSFLDSSMYGGNHFFGDNFSIFHQSIYFSLQINIALVILLFTNFFKSKYKYILVVFFGLVIFQVSNRVNILIYILILISGVFYIKKLKTKVLIALSVLLIGSVLVINNSRTRAALKKITAFNFTVDREAEDSFGTRILVWDASIKTIRDSNFMGVGVSNSYSALKKVYKEKRYVIPFRNRLNSHNQYFQILIECGIIGFLVLLLIQITLLKLKTHSKYLNVYIVLIFTLNFIFESVFSRYSGLICFVIFYCCMIALKNNKPQSYFSVNKIETSS